MNDFYPVLDAIIQSHLSANAINAELTANIAKDIIDDVVKAFGGQMVYMKNNMLDRIRAKHRKIAAEFDGRNAIALCRKYKISCSWVKKIIEREAFSPENA